MSDQEIIPQVPGETSEQEQPKLTKAQEKAMAKAKDQAPGLPEQSSVNPAKITRAVLTKDGYVVPLNLGKKAG